MADIQPRSTNVPKGLETTRDANSSRLAWAKYDNSRTAEDSDKRRAGYNRLYRFAAPSVLMDFDGTDDDVDLSADASIRPLGTVWTVEVLFQTDDIASTRTILGKNAASKSLKIVHNTSSEVVVTATDTANTDSTLTWTGIAAGTLCALQIVRDGATLTGYLNGTSATTTIHATNTLATGAMTVGSDNNANFFDGRVDFLRILRYAKSNRLDAWARLVDPRTPGVLVDYIFEPDANGYVLDRGALGLHTAAVNGTPATNVAPLAVNPMPVLGIASNLDKNFKRQAYVRVAGSIYPVSWL